jgi:hypothetical protein
MNLTNCTITGNSAPGFGGGGISNTYVATEVLTVTNCTIVGNTAAFGGGIRSDPSGMVNLFNTIVAANTAGTSNDFDGAVATASNNLIGDGTGATGLTNGVSGNIVGTTSAPINPVVGPLGNYGGQTPTLPLLPGSPAINAAGANAPTTDQRGIARPQQGVPDIGAFESRGFTMVITSGNNESGLLNQPYPLPLVVTITSEFGEPVVGGQVTFTGPSNPAAAEVLFSNGMTSIVVTITGTSATASTGQASTLPTANNVAGQVLVSANANGAVPNPVIFTLFNVQTYLVVGADAGALPEVKVYNPVTGAVVFDFLAFSPSFRGGVRVASADVNGDGYFDIICAAGPGGGPEVRVFSGKDASLLSDFYAFTPSFTGGVYVAAGNVTGSNVASVICGAGEGGGPQITVFGGDGTPQGSFFAFPVFFTGGVRVAAGDLAGSGVDDIVAGAGPGAAPEVAIFGGPNFSLLSAFFAFPVNFSGGVFVAAGPLTLGSPASIVVGAGEGALPQVNVFNGQTEQLIDAFFAAPPQLLKVDGGEVSPSVRVAVACQFCPQPFIMTAQGPFSSPQVNEYSGATFGEINSFEAFNTVFQGGIFIGGA